MYDSLGRVILETNPDGSQTQVTYEDANNRVTATLPNGSQVTYQYDPLGNLVQQTDALGSTIQTYDEFGRMISQTDAEGNVSTYTYDAYGRVLTENDGTSTTAYAYDDVARTQTTKDGEGNQIRETYDILGRLIKTEELKSTGNTTLSSSTYDNYGHLLSTIDANNNKTSYGYDAAGNLTSVTDAEGKTTSYKYDLLGNMIQQTYADGQFLANTYDEIGRLLKTTDPLKQSETYTYDANSNLVTYVDRKGQTHAYQYNNRNFLTQDSAPGENITYTYDAMGNRKTMKDSTGTTSYGFSPTGQLTSLTYPDQAKLTFDYDKRGIRKSQTFTSGSYKLSLETTYQGASALPGGLNVKNTASTSIASLTYKYLKNNSLQQTATGTGLTHTLTYTGLNVTGLTVASKDTTLQTYTYGYDNNRNITSQKDNGTSYTYTYDVLNRIKASSQFNETYGYDQRDNRSSLTSDRTPTIPSTTTYQYDSRNRLTKATVNGISLAYTYNGDGLMVGRIKGSQTTRYYYDDRGLLVAEGNVSGSTVTIAYGYVYDATGQLVGRQSGTESKLQYYVTNLHGDVVELRDASGKLLNSYSYDIWGNPVIVQETVPNALRYAGEYWDADTGLQYLRARWYDPSTARFIGEDTYEGQIDNPLSLNLYTYVENNPLGYVDPTGHSPSYFDDDEAAFRTTNGFKRSAARTFIDEEYAPTQLGVKIYGMAPEDFNRLPPSVQANVRASFEYKVTQLKKEGIIPNIGTLTGSLNGLKSYEKTVIDDLLNQGKNVEVLQTSNQQGVKTPDLKVNGVLTELKTLTGTSLNTGVTRIQEAFKQGAAQVIIDARSTNLSLSDAQSILSRAAGTYANKVLPGSVEIWINGSIVTQ
ncbi:RHS repeat-associated core domain-containing protein [Paenibacillus pinistramenti]|uniref:RHS repeat-associated core domain-containing protein n=1 Tax=Paenibacillus pinistramenti TaxID=1768003 RepID=UPI001107FEA6|nr:RHS repeat-associated core domain-containing protein [Paenibacillus pinistramenti]